VWHNVRKPGKNVATAAVSLGRKCAPALAMPGTMLMSVPSGTITTPASVDIANAAPSWRGTFAKSQLVKEVQPNVLLQQQCSRSY
jgi:hypothetical protein